VFSFSKGTIISMIYMDDDQLLTMIPYFDRRRADVVNVV
jgi:hypothetical protein